MREGLRTLGTYGTPISNILEFYDFEHVLLLRRVMTGAGGERLADHARAATIAEDPGRGRADLSSGPRAREAARAGGGRGEPPALEN